MLVVIWIRCAFASYVDATVRKYASLRGYVEVYHRFKSRDYRFRLAQRSPSTEVYIAFGTCRRILCSARRQCWEVRRRRDLCDRQPCMTESL